jgi:HlyD family secretion protein
VPITASIDGQVLRVLRKSEGIVTAGEPLLELGDTADLEIVVDLLSTDAVKVLPGQRVVFTDWGGSADLAGTVERVEPYAYTKVSALGIEEKRVNVIIDLNTPYEKRVGLGHGYKLETSIVLWEGDDTLTVPLTALFRSGDQWALFVEENGRAAQRQVVLGRKTGLLAEVVDGLNVGERIVLYPSDRVQDSSRIAQRETGS